MKTILVTFLILIAIIASCKKDNVVKGYYEYMQYVHEGSGQIEFKVYPTDNIDLLKVVVNKYNFRDTTIETTIENVNTTAFSNYHKAIGDQAQINGSFKQSSLETGVWISIYVGTNNNKTEVTNIDLRNSLLCFEQLVKNKLSLK
jgi:hypothetical protein